MLGHLTSIPKDINLLLNDNNYKFDNKKINTIREYIQSFKGSLEKSNDTPLIDPLKVKEISELIYELNSDNLFSTLTDRISNVITVFTKIVY